MAKEVKKVAFLTAGGLAPCLSSSIGFLIDEYNKVAPNVQMIGYVNGYMGLLRLRHSRRLGRQSGHSCRLDGYFPVKQCLELTIDN